MWNCIQGVSSLLVCSYESNVASVGMLEMWPLALIGMGLVLGIALVTVNAFMEKY